jgi:lipopolysaccharide/colanic/teichoic acid biosynthesis glycosyltransferase
MDNLSGQNYNKTIKRFIDIVFSLVFLVVFSPIYLIVAILIKMDSDGPIFADVPARLGLHGKYFKMLKFRSMICNAHMLLRTDKRFKKLYEEYKAGNFKLKNDPRVTKIGKYLRKYSIDEFPQFINVLRGEMSVVGPRAYYPDELETQTKIYPESKKYLTKVMNVKPGITGLWQVSGRSDVDFDKRIVLDAKYVDELSLPNDLEIIFKTPYVMISGRGAV